MTSATSTSREPAVAPRRRALRLSACALIVCLLSCATVPPEQPPPSAAVGREESLSEIQRLAAGGEYRELRRTGREFLSRYPGDPAGNEVRLQTATACIELGLYDEASDLLAPLLAGGAADAQRGRAALLMGDLLRAKGRFVEAAASLLDALAAAPSDAERERAYTLLGEVVGLLSRDQLDILRRSHASSPGIELVLAASLSYARAAHDSSAAGEIAAELEKAAAYAHGSTERPFEGSAAVVPKAQEEGGGRRQFSIGLLCPLSGRYAPLGEEFLKGASVALKEARRRGMTGVEIIVGDTRGNPLTARSIAERLVAEKGVVALVGDVLSSSTIAAAQVAECRGIALLSPAATDEGIAAIGDWVFHTTPEIEAEVTAVAAFAVDELALGRIAFLAVDDLRSRRIGELFEREVGLRGGEITARGYYPEGSTDFRDTIQMIRDSAPEALFIASDIEDLILILPQLSFYEFGVQLFGLSTWNSQRLQRMVGRDMEGALFPGRIGAESDEEQFAAAAALVDSPVDETNPFVVGGFKGVRSVLEALPASGGERTALRDELSRELRNRLHPFLELVSGRGIPFYTIRNERLELYGTLRSRR